MREKKRGPGRPGFGITEKTYLIRAAEDLLDAMKDEAAKQKITTSEAWRRAARAWLGLKPDDYELYQKAARDELSPQEEKQARAAGLLKTKDD